MIDLRYWDSGVFLAWLLPEADRRAACESVIRAAEHGDVRIVTSAITLTEVIRLKDHPPLKRQQESKINAFFKHKYIIVRALDRPIAEFARQLIWEFPALKPKDSIHVATALRSKTPVVDSFDNDLLKLNEQLGSPPLRIGSPHVPVQLELTPRALPKMSPPTPSDEK